MTDFKQVYDNAKTVAPNNSLNNTTSPITISPNTSRFMPAITNGAYVTIYNKTTYPDAGDDPNMEIALITAIGSGSMTLQRDDPKTHTGTPAIELFLIAQIIQDIHDAINALEAADANFQPLDGDLTAIAGLTPSNDDVIQRKAGAWVNRSMSQLKTDLGLTKSDVGLSNVPNTDATARANHTGTQLSTTISDFSEAVDDRVATLLTAGTNVTLTYDDTANTLTIGSTASGSSFTVADGGYQIEDDIFIGNGYIVGMSDNGTEYAGRYDDTGAWHTYTVLHDETGDRLLDEDGEILLAG